MSEKMYSVAIRRRLNNEDHFWFHDDYTFIECKIDTCDGRYWFADPFLFEKGKDIYLFYEAFDLIDQKGKVAYSILREGGTWSKPKIVIDENYHMSFPNIFENNGNIYIMPEMCGDYSLKLYKAKCFPDKWEIADTILPDVYACDSIFVNIGNMHYLLTNEMYHNVPQKQYASCWVKNYIYRMEGLKVVDHGTWIAEGDYGIRNAGRSFVIGGKVYRIGQDCRERLYGRGMVLFEIISLKPYSEKEIYSWHCSTLSKHLKRDSKDKVLGIHTYNFSDNYEVIDFSTNKQMKSLITCRRYLYKMVRFFFRGLRFFKII